MNNVAQFTDDSFRVAWTNAYPLQLLSPKRWTYRIQQPNIHDRYAGHVIGRIHDANGSLVEQNSEKIGVRGCMLG